MTTKHLARSAPWFADGLQFTCTQCGNCCTGDPGLVYVSNLEADHLAEHMGMDAQAFRRQYTITVYGEHGTQLSLKERPDNGGHACIFWRKKVGCTIYEQRPTQCRTWPFWRRVVSNPAAWNREAKACPGMDQGELHTASAIAETATKDGLPS